MKKILSYISLIVVVFLSVSIIPFFAETTDFTQEDANSLEAAKEKLEQINERQSELLSSLKYYSSQKNSELKAKQTLEQQIAETEDKIETINWLLENLEYRLDEMTVELEIAQAEFDDYYEKYTSRIRETYEMGEMTYLEVIILSDNFSDMLKRYDYIRDMMEYDKNLLESMRENIDNIIVLQETIISDRATYSEMLEMLSEEKKTQSSQIVELNERISYITSNIDELKIEQDEFAKLEAEFEAEINKLLDKKKKYSGETFIWPLDSKWKKITSPFDWRTFNKKKEFHYAIDIMADVGSPIYASADGTIIYYGWTNTGGGNKCVIDHGSKLVTHYNHMDEFVPELQKKFKENGSVDVKQGDIIGYVGRSGTATGYHLDFKILYDGTPVDPALYVTADGSTPEKDIMDLLKK